MKKLTILLAALAVMACAKTVPVPQEFHVIPMPAQVSITEGAFCVKGVQISVDPAMDELSQKAVGRFVEALETATGTKTKSGKKGICFTVNADLAPEAYCIDIKADGVSVQASQLHIPLARHQALLFVFRNHVLISLKKKGPPLLQSGPALGLITHLPRVQAGQ